MDNTTYGAAVSDAQKLVASVVAGIDSYAVSGTDLIITTKDGQVLTISFPVPKDGKDGVSVIHEWVGTVLKITSASGTSEADLKGVDGTTPELTPGTIEVLPYGATPQIVITGTKEKPVLNLALPQGKPGEGSDYELPVATSARLGGVKIGNGFTTDPDGTIHATAQSIDLTDYYKRTETDTLLTKKLDKVEGMGLSHNDLTDELLEKINASTKSMQLKDRVDTADDLPADPAVGDTYFVGLEGASEFEQYTYTESGWLKTGTTSADLAKYLLKDEAMTLLAGKVDKEEGKGLFPVVTTI